MNQPSQSVFGSIVAGGLAGASETIVTYPAEFAKTRRQLEVSARGRTAPSSFAVLQSTFRQHGLAGIYAGCQTLALSNALKSSVRFFAFENAKRTLRPYFASNTTSHSQSPWLNLCAGLCAGFTESVLVVTPGEALKTRVIHDASSGSGHLGRMSIAQLIKHTVRQDGVLALWRGVTPVICKQGTNSAVRFTTFGALKDKLQGSYSGVLTPATATMIAGAGSGVITVYASMPFDNIKTRMQSIGGSGQRMLSTARNMLVNEGVSVFWRATTPRLVRLTLSSSITFMVYEKCLTIFQALGSRMEERDLEAKACV